MITDMVSCVKELTLQGFAVKIDDLAIFSIGIRNKEGAALEKGVLWLAMCSARPSMSTV
jgi:glucose/arabinose dehydrogenase